MVASRFTIEQAVEMLETQPRRIAAATKGVSARRLRRDKVLGEWTAVDILAHLRACSDALGDVIPDIVRGGEPLRAVNPRSHIRRTNYRELEFATSFRAFARQRARLVKYLKALPRRDWARSRLFTGMGTPRVRTVMFYADWLAGHERAHVRHIERAFASATRRRNSRRMKAGA